MHSTFVMTDTRASSLYIQLTHQHEHLATLFDQLLAAMKLESADVAALWDEIEQGLLAHMESEERFILPAFARIDREEAVALLREHGAIREQLLELGIAIDLHCIRYERSREFIETLRRHAQREQKLYRWADTRLSQGRSEALRDDLVAGAPHAFTRG